MVLGPLTENVLTYEKELIEAALAESNGKVAGPSGAAAKLGIPRSTLDLKIKQLNIKKTTSGNPSLNSQNCGPSKDPVTSGYSGEGERIFLREAERHSGVKVNSSGAKRRWRDACARSVRHRQLKTSGAKRRIGLSGDLGCGERGCPFAPASSM